MVNLILKKIFIYRFFFRKNVISIILVFEKYILKLN